MKRFFRLVIVAIWFTAPAISLLIVRDYPSDAAGYPFFGMFSGMYGVLHFATDSEFVTIVLGMTVFWIALGAASLLIDQSWAMKYLLILGAAIELCCALIVGAGAVTIALDAVFIAVAYIVGKKRNTVHYGLRTASQIFAQTSDKSCD